MQQVYSDRPKFEQSKLRHEPMANTLNFEITLKANYTIAVYNTFSTTICKKKTFYYEIKQEIFLSSSPMF